MESLNGTFVSSTFWTEKIGTIAALETLKLMKKLKIMGNYFKNWEKKLNKIGLI